MVPRTASRHLCYVRRSAFGFTGEGGGRFQAVLLSSSDGLCHITGRPRSASAGSPICSQCGDCAQLWHSNVLMCIRQVLDGELRSAPFVANSMRPHVHHLGHDRMPLAFHPVGWICRMIFLLCRSPLGDSCVHVRVRSSLDRKCY